MNSANFTEWKQKLPDLVQNQIIEQPGSKWGRVICVWKEKKETSAMEHLYAVTINLQNGDIYLDCRPRKIWAKCCLYTVIQPILLTAKTIYHMLLPFSTAVAIYQTVQAAKQEETKISAKELSKRIVVAIAKNVADIFRTPVYALALTIVTLAALIIGPLAPKSLFHFRMALGNMEKSLYWGNGDSAWILFKCFQPVENLMTVDQWNRRQPDTEYLHEHGQENPTMNGLTNFARAQVQFRRHNNALFNDCLHKFPENKAYISAALAK